MTISEKFIKLTASEDKSHLKPKQERFETKVATGTKCKMALLLLHEFL